jgi:hypothetical protein
MCACQRVGAMRAARLGTGQTMVKTLEQPGLKPAGIAGRCEPLQHRRRRGRTDHGWALAVNVSGQKRGGSQVIRG